MSRRGNIYDKMEHVSDAAVDYFGSLVDTPEKRNISASIISVFVGFLISGILILIIGYRPLEVYFNIFKGSIFKDLFEGNFSRLGDTLLRTSTLILVGLAVAFAFKTGLFNIGVSGQMLFGGFLAVYFGLTLDLPKPLLMTVCTLFAMLGGALWALVPGLLKAFFRINEVVVSIMMNYAAVWVVHFLVRTNIIGAYETESRQVGYNALLRVKRMTDFFDGSVVNISLFLAIIAAFVVWFILNKTVFGYELKAVGSNHDAAKYAGIKVNKNIVLAFVISGALSGLAGASFYIGYMNHIKIGTLPTLGFDGIAVSLLGLNSPIGVLLSAFLFGILRNGGEYVNATIGISKQLIDIIVSLIVYFAAISLIIRNLLQYFSKIINGEVK